MTMKAQVVRKILIGVILSAFPIIGLIQGGMEAQLILPMLFIVIWNIGEVYAAPYYLNTVIDVSVHMSKDLAHSG